MIELEGSSEFAVSRELLWEMILDPTVLSSILPGCDNLAEVNEYEYQGQLKLKIGPVDGVFRGTVTLSDLREFEGFHLVINGRGPSGVIEGQGRVSLEESGSGTRFYYDASGQISGRMATVGQRVMTSSAKAVVKQSLENLDKQVQARSRPQLGVSEAGEGTVAEELTTPSDEAPSPPDQTEFMLGVAENMLEELLPDPGQRRLLKIVAMTAGAVLLLNWFANVVARKVVRMLEDDR